MSKSTKVFVTIVACAILALIACLTSPDISVAIGLGALAVGTVLDDAIAAAVAQAEKNEDAEASATVILNSIPTLIQNAVNDALSKGATDAQLQALADLKAKLESSLTPMAAAIVANTPSAPPAGG